MINTVKAIKDRRVWRAMAGHLLKWQKKKNSIVYSIIFQSGFMLEITYF